MLIAGDPLSPPTSSVLNLAAGERGEGAWLSRALLSGGMAERREASLSAMPSRHILSANCTLARWIFRKRNKRLRRERAIARMRAVLEEHDAVQPRYC